MDGYVVAFFLALGAILVLVFVSKSGGERKVKSSKKKKSKSSLDSTTEPARSFLAAVAYINSHKDSTSLSEKQQLQLYGLYKQSTEGQCNTKRPGVFDLVGAAKWDAWNSVKELSKGDAMKQYTELIDSLAPGWRQDSESNSQQVSKPKKRGMGPVFSTFAQVDDGKEKSEVKDVWKCINEENIQWLRQGLDSKEFDLNTTEEEGMTVLQFAVDRGNAEIVSLLLDRGASINAKDNDGQTALHYASIAGDKDMVKLLLERGVDVSIKDDDGMTALDVAEEDSVKELIGST